MCNKSQVSISVIIPTRHRNELLGLCLERLAPGAQTLPAEQYEVIVTDDGVHTTSKAMVREQFPWVKWIAGPCKGPAANRNNGVRWAHGKWLAFTDDDCLPSPEWLAGYVKALDCATSVYEGKTTCEAGILSPLYEAPINASGGKLWSCNLMFEVEFFQSMQGFDPDYTFAMEDIDMRDRLLRQQQRVLFVPEAVVDHPPRRQPSGLIIGRHTEGYVRYWYKFGNHSPYWITFLKHIKHRLYCLKQFQLSQDLILAYLSLIVEIVYVVFHLPKWQRKFQAQYKTKIVSKAHTAFPKL